MDRSYLPGFIVSQLIVKLDGPANMGDTVNGDTVNGRVDVVGVELNPARVQGLRLPLAPTASSIFRPPTPEEISVSD